MENAKIQRSNKMADMPMGKLITSISLPMVISLLVQSLYNLVDSVFVSRLSEAALSATSLASPIQMLMLAVSIGTGVGINSLLSRTIGAGNRAEASSVATNGLFLAVASSVLFVLIGFFAVPTFIGSYTDDPELFEMGVTYLRICTVFSLGIFVATTAERMLQATGNTFLSMIAQVSGAVANCILDPILIFGFAGIPSMGIKGAAIATVAGQWLAAAVALIFNFKLNHDIRFEFKGFKLRGDIIGKIYKVGVPSMLATALGSVQTIIINKMILGIEALSTTGVAFFGIYHKVQNFVFMPLNGLTQGLIPIVGFAYGAKRGDRIRDALKITAVVCLAMMVFFMLVFIAIPGPILSLFAAQDKMRSIGIPALRILSLGFVFAGGCTLIGHTFTAMGNGLVNMMSTAIRCLLPIPVIYLIAKYADVAAIWWAIPLADACAFVLAGCMFIRGYKNIIKPLISTSENV
ncbi:MAG: MATE family efflux transporter [Oscillospiraceae bacterium]